MTGEAHETETDPQIVDVEHPEPKIVGGDEGAQEAIAEDKEVEQQATDPKVAAEAGDAADVAETNLEDRQPGKVLDAIAAKVEDAKADSPAEGEPG
jgi:hypothetical protein